jgi:hypothetical protein
MNARFLMASSLVIALLLGDRIPAEGQSTVTIGFDNLGAERGVTPAGTSAFEFRGTSWSGGTVRTERIPALYASDRFSYEVANGGAVVLFSVPVVRVRFFFVHGFGFASGTAVALSEDGEVVGSAESRQASSFAAAANFVVLESAVPIVRLEVSSGVVDSFTFETADIPPTPTPEATPTPSATATPSLLCPGDCGGDAEVTVDEILRGLNIALGAASVDSCLAADGNRDGVVTVDEIVAAVNAALAGCS